MADSTPSNQHSLDKRRASRLAAVQYLYQWHLNQKPPAVEPYIAQYSERLLETEDEKAGEEHPLRNGAAPDFAFLRKLLLGLNDEHQATRSFLEKLMEKGRPLHRTSPLIQSLLEVGSYELIHYESLSASIILSEYTAIAAGFFDNPELAFVNGTLQEVANHLRP
jgi:transcription termination factor NusB